MLERFRGKASPLALPGLQERRAEVMVRQNGAPRRGGSREAIMYTSLLRLYVDVAQKSPLLYIGLIVLLMASWGLIVSAITEIAIRFFDIPDGR